MWRGWGSVTLILALRDLFATVDLLAIMSSIISTSSLFSALESPPLPSLDRSKTVFFVDPVQGPNPAVSQSHYPATQLESPFLVTTWSSRPLHSSPTSTSTYQRDLEGLGSPSAASFTSEEHEGEHRIPRPMNSWMLFRADWTAKHKGKGEKGNLSIRAAVEWRNLSDGERAVWVRKAEQAKAQHLTKYPNYKYRPNRKGPPGASSAIKTAVRARATASSTDVTVSGSLQASGAKCTCGSLTESSLAPPCVPSPPTPSTLTATDENHTFGVPMDILPSGVLPSSPTVHMVPITFAAPVPTHPISLSQQLDTVFPLGEDAERSAAESLPAASNDYQALESSHVPSFPHPSRPVPIDASLNTIHSYGHPVDASELSEQVCHAPFTSPVSSLSNGKIGPHRRIVTRARTNTYPYPSRPTTFYGEARHPSPRWDGPSSSHPWHPWSSFATAFTGQPRCGDAFRAGPITLRLADLSLSTNGPYDGTPVDPRPAHHHQQHLYSAAGASLVSNQFGHPYHPALHAPTHQQQTFYAVDVTSSPSPSSSPSVSCQVTSPSESPTSTYPHPYRFPPLSTDSFIDGIGLDFHLSTDAKGSANFLDQAPQHIEYEVNFSFDTQWAPMSDHLESTGDYDTWVQLHATPSY